MIRQREQRQKKRGEITDREKADREDRRSYDAQHHESLRSSVKSLAILNSGGVAVMLGFIQAVIGKEGSAIFSAYGMLSVTCFAIGAVSAALAFMPMGRHFSSGAKDDKYVGQIAYMMAGALTFAVAGFVVMLRGVYKAF